MPSSSRRKKAQGRGGAGEVAGGGSTVAPVSTTSVSTGKENSMPETSARAATQKLNVRPTAQFDEPESAAGEEPRLRNCTSSAPRVRNSNPLEFSSALSDTRSSRVSVGQPLRKVNNTDERLSKKFHFARRASKDLDINVRVLNEIGGCSKENERTETTKRVNGGDDDVAGVSVNSSNQEVRVSRDLVKNGRTVDELDGINPENAKKKIRMGSCNNEKMNLRSAGVGAKVVSSLRELKMVNRGSGVVRDDGRNKYPSKLHEKPALLEEKVNQAALDIKLTKDMLDRENLDASGLSDIHERIAGIEKAMGQCRHDGDTGMGSVKSDENDKMEVGNAKCLVENSKKTESQLSHGMANVEEDKVNSVNTNDVADAQVSEVKEMDNVMAWNVENSSLNDLSGKDDFDALLMADEKLNDFDALLMADEKLNDFDDQQKVPEPGEEFEENYMNELNGIGCKSSTAGWFVSEGESVILAHDDGSCSFYDIIHDEVKAEYKPPVGIWPNAWRDCWIIHAPGGDGCLGKYILAASAGNAVGPGFCSWDFYTKDVKAFHIDDENAPVRTALAPLPNKPMYRRNPATLIVPPVNRQWWYKPCGPLIVSAASCQRMVQIYDIRDGDQVVKWGLSKPVVSMDYASPLQWRNTGKVVIAESDAVSLWDVGSPSSGALQSVYSFGQRISALHVNNTDSEQGGGVRQRISSMEAEGNDGVFCTPNSINVLDFRQPNGIAVKIPKPRLNAQSVFSNGDSIFIGCTTSGSVGKNHTSSQIQLFSLRKHRLLSIHQLPESNAHHSFTALTQVWGSSSLVRGNSSLVMGICGLGLFVFDSFKDGNPQPVAAAENAKEVIGRNNMCSPSFDYSGSRVLLISRDRPACWRYLF